jgi:hypothetical protein
MPRARTPVVVAIIGSVGVVIAAAIPACREVIIDFVRPPKPLVYRGAVRDTLSNLPVKNALVVAIGRPDVAPVRTDDFGNFQLTVPAEKGAETVSIRLQVTDISHLEFNRVIELSKGQIETSLVIAPRATPAPLPAPRPSVSREPSPRPLSECTGLLTKEKVWKGLYRWSCDPGPEHDGGLALRLDTLGTLAIVERYSALISVRPNQVYTVSYWVRTELEVEKADVFGKIVPAEYARNAKESDNINDNRLEPGFALGENVGGVTGWTHKAYSFTTRPDTAFVRIRAIIGGPEGYSGGRGRFWLFGVSISKP